MKKTENPMEYLPEELWFRIFEIGIQNPTLVLKDVASASISCKHFNRLLNDDALWSLLLSRDFPQYAGKLSFSSLPTKKLVYKHTLGRYARSKIRFAKRHLSNIEVLLEHTENWTKSIQRQILNVKPKMDKLSRDLLDLINASVPFSSEEKEALKRMRVRIDEVREASIAAINNSNSGQDPFAAIPYLSDATSRSKLGEPIPPSTSPLLHLETKGNVLVSSSWGVLSEHQLGQCLSYTLLREKQEHSDQLEIFSSCLASLTSGPNPIEIGDNDDEDEDDDNEDEDDDNDDDDDDDDDSDSYADADDDDDDDDVVGDYADHDD